MNEIKTGFLPDTKDERDLVFGSDNSLGARYAGREKLQPSANWDDFLVEPEFQSPVGETNSCVAHATLSAIEIYARLFGNHYNFSDRFLAVMSDTDPNRGNTPRKVASVLKHNWTVFEKDWSHEVESVKEFYKPLPESLVRRAQVEGEAFDFGYEKVNAKDISVALQYSPLCISVPAWFEANGKYYRPGKVADTHWTVCYGIEDNGDLKVFDSYPPYTKIVRADMVPSTVYSYYLDPFVLPWWKIILKRLFV